MERLRSWIERSPYGKLLGLHVDSLSETAARFVLPFQAGNANPGGALHGGIYASLIAVGGQAIARACLGQNTGPWHTAGVQVAYLAAAMQEGVVAEARLLRRGKELCFVDVEVQNEAKKPLARGLVTVRGRLGASEPPTPSALGDDGMNQPGSMGPEIESLSFTQRLGVRIENMHGGRSRIRLPLRETNFDADGGLHEGAVLSLLDTTGALAAWSITGPGPFKASTPAIQAQILAVPPREELVAYARVAHQDRELFWSEVEVARAKDQRLVARGTVIYRIVVGGEKES